MVEPQGFGRPVVPTAHSLIFKIFGIGKLEPLDEFLAHGIGDLAQLELIA